MRWNKFSKRSVFLWSVLIAVILIASFLLIFFIQRTGGNDSLKIVLVGEVATGDGSGSDWENQADWSKLAYKRGYTYFLADGTYAGRTFSTPKEDTSFIRIIKATETEHGSNTGWETNLGDGQAIFTGELYFSTSFWVLDGAKGGMSKIDADYGFMFKPIRYGIRLGSEFEPQSDFIISHIAATAPDGDFEKIFLRTGDRFKQVRNVTISYNLLNGWQNGYWATNDPQVSLPQKDWIFEYNICLNGFSSHLHHGEWINNNYAYMLDQITRYNLFEGGGNGMTGIIVANNNDNKDAQIYGNVFKDLTVSNGVVTSTSQGKMINAKVYNNTLIHVNTVGGWLGLYESPDSEAYNNLLYDMIATPGGEGYTRDYNAYFNTRDTPSEPHRQIGKDSPFVDVQGGHYQLATGTQRGISLDTSFAVDKDGLVRGEDGIWDRGAFEYVSDGSEQTSLPSSEEPFSQSPDGLPKELSSSMVFNEATYSLGTGYKGQMIVEFDVEPLHDNIDTCIGYLGSSNRPAKMDDPRMILALDKGGYFDVMDYNIYTNLVEVPYAANKIYHIKMITDLSQKTYSVWVTAPDSSPVMIAKDYRFRNNPLSMDDIGYISFYSYMDDNQAILTNHTITQGMPDQADEAATAANTSE